MMIRCEPTRDSIPNSHTPPPPLSLARPTAPNYNNAQELLYLTFPSETVTRSGYQIVRRNFVAAGVKRDRLYVLAASARSDQFNKEKAALLQHVVQSFRLR